MGIGEIMGSHKPALDKEEAKGKKERVDEIVKELVPEPPAQAPKPKGRPRKNSTDKPIAPKTPPRAQQDEFPMPASTSSAEEVADKIANKAAIRRLRVYARRFPQFSPTPQEYNPHLHTAKENILVIEAIKEAVRSEIEFLTAPSLISDSIRNAEGMAMAWAVTNPGHPVAPHLMNLHTAASAVLSDPAVDLDIGLMECELQGFMPESPIARLLINVVRVLGNVWTENKVSAVIPPQAKTENENKFKDF